MLRVGASVRVIWCERSGRGQLVGARFPVVSSRARPRLISREVDDGCSGGERDLVAVNSLVSASRLCVHLPRTFFVGEPAIVLRR